MTHPAVQLSGVAKHFGEVVALKGIDLSIADGEFFSLLVRQVAAKRPRCVSLPASNSQPRIDPDSRQGDGVGAAQRSARSTRCFSPMRSFRI